MNRPKFFFHFLGRVSLQEQINFARYLSLTIKAGLPLFEGLKVIRKQTASKSLMRVLDQAIVDVNNGQSLAGSLERWRGIFGDFFINIVRIGETSGTLSENLRYLAEELQKSKTLRGKIKSAMVYPLIILVATLGIVSFLVFYVFPKIAPIFESLRLRLPIATKILIVASEFIIAYWPWILAALALLFILWRVLLFLPASRFFFHRAILMIPVVSSLAIGVNMANFSRVMGVLLRSGVKIVEAVMITSKTLSNLVYRRALDEAAMKIQKGEQLAESLLLNKRIFPPLLSNMIQIGENTGNLQDNLFYLSDYYVEEVDLRVKNLTTLLEPLLLLIMGLLVGFVALAIITPIYEISSGVSR